MRFWISLFFSISLFAVTIDEYYKDTLSFLTDTIRSIDVLLSDNNVSLKQKFSIRTSVDTIMESREPIRFRFNFRANLSLPRTQKRLNLFLQEFRKSDNIEDETQNSINRSIQDRSFLIGLQYLTRHNLTYRLGVRFRGISPDPFIMAGWENTTYFNNNLWIYYGDRAYYYIDRHLDNRLFASLQSRLDNRSLFTLNNSYRYQEYIKEHQFTHALTWFRSIDRYKFFSPTIMLYATQSPDHGYRISNYYIGITYHDRFYRDWLFYEIEPGLIWRDEYNFKLGFRCLLRVGVTFERY